MPLLLGITDDSSGNADPLTASKTDRPKSTGALAPADLLPFLNDLAAGFTEGSMADVITPTLSLFFQEWFKITPTPDLMGSEWRKYLGAVSLLVQVKSIAALLPTLPVWVAPNVTAPKIEWQSLLGPLTRLSVFSREFVSVSQIELTPATNRKDVLCQPYRAPGCRHRRQQSQPPRSIRRSAVISLQHLQRYRSRRSRVP